MLIRPPMEKMVALLRKNPMLQQRRVYKPMANTMYFTLSGMLVKLTRKKTLK